MLFTWTRSANHNYLIAKNSNHHFLVTNRHNKKKLKIKGIDITQLAFTSQQSKHQNNR